LRQWQLELELGRELLEVVNWMALRLP